MASSTRPTLAAVTRRHATLPRTDAFLSRELLVSLYGALTEVVLLTNIYTRVYSTAAREVVVAMLRHCNEACNNKSYDA